MYVDSLNMCQLMLTINISVEFSFDISWYILSQ